MSETAATKTKPARADASRNEACLVTVARTMFVEKGIDTSLEEIAKQAGVGIGTLYRHFPNRQALVEAVLLDHMKLLVEQGEQLLDENNAYDALVIWLQAVLQQITTYRGVTKPLALALIQCGSGQPNTCQMMRDTGDQLMQRAQSQGLVRDDINIGDIMSMVNAVGWIAEQGEVESAKRSLQVVLDGMRTSK
jgi:AcrR family transcriptional regulator